MTERGSVCQVGYSLTGLMEGLLTGQHQQSRRQVGLQNLLKLYGLPTLDLKEGAVISPYKDTLYKDNLYEDNFP